MKKLTETIVKQRVRSCVTNIEKIVQINLTGRELEDVSLLRKMTSVEILSLSFNQISSLVDFQYCENLKELYLRRNNISDINQIQYLIKLNKLENLMLSENPCSNDPIYRHTIIKNLPTLTTLDGISISLDERREASSNGKEVRISNSSIDLKNKNCIPDGPQIFGSSTPNSQKLKQTGKEQVTPPVANPVEDQECQLLKKEENKIAVLKNNVTAHNTSSSLYAIGTLKSPKQISRNDSTKCLNKLKEAKPSSCKFCQNQLLENPLNLIKDSKCNRLVPKSSNIMSATLNLIKELDYPSLQIINAEIVSRLNSLEAELIYNIKSQN